MPSKRESSARVDYVPALCTHRPSLLPIGCAGEASGLDAGDGSPLPAAEKFVKTLPPRGRRSRNKVSVGEPAEGSLNLSTPTPWTFKCPPGLASKGASSCVRPSPAGGAHRADRWAVARGAQAPRPGTAVGHPGCQPVSTLRWAFQPEGGRARSGGSGGVVLRPWRVCGRQRPSPCPARPVRRGHPTPIKPQSNSLKLENAPVAQCRRRSKPNQ